MYQVQNRRKQVKVSKKRWPIYGASVVLTIVGVTMGLSHAAQVSQRIPVATTGLVIESTPASDTTSAPVVVKSTAGASVDRTSVPTAAANAAIAGRTASAAPVTTNSVQTAASYSGLSLYLNPNGNTAKAAHSYVLAHPASAAALSRITNQPTAEWFGDWNSDLAGAVNNYVTAAASSAQLPVLVAYDIPNRDCGSYSAGGATSAAAYNAWIQTMANAIGQRPAMVILEPDAVAGLDCLDATGQQNRLQLLANAVHVFKTTTAASVYIDAGNPTWQSVATMQQRLTGAGLAAADGFSLNISNFIKTSDNTSYGSQLSRASGGKHFIIDTGRNGNGPANDGQWCNPGGRALGAAPTLQTGNPLIDAYLWIKPPGESDGSCGPQEAGTTAPSAGSWWGEYALSLL